MTIYSARWYVTKAAANNEKRDARLLYIMVLASRRTHYRLRGVRRDSFLVDVIWQCFCA